MSRLAKDIEVVTDLFPKLRVVNDAKGRPVELIGQLDIVGVDKGYCSTFYIQVIIPAKYPFDIPVLIELSKKIPRGDDRHVNEQGVCCVEIEHKLLDEARKGISIERFLVAYAYPFFANQLYYEKENRFANKTWGHLFAGVEQYYSEELGLNDPRLIVNILHTILNNRIPGRNKPCLCGSRKKLKNCHVRCIDFLQRLGIERLAKDLVEFRKLL